MVAALKVLAEGSRIQGWPKIQGKILTQEVLGENLVAGSKIKEKVKAETEPTNKKSPGA